MLCPHGRVAILLMAVAPLMMMMMAEPAAAISCAPAAGQDPVEISSEWINDGYCDCPLDGSDEPGTSACSGSTSGGWAGLSPRVGVAQNDAAEDDELAESDAPVFTCPQQPKVSLPVSRTNDGICDCCDGADEANNPEVTCADDCAAVLAAEREARAKVVEAFQKGSQLRQQGITEYERAVKEAEAKTSTMRTQIEALSTDAVTQQLEAAKLKYWQTAHRQAVQSLSKHPDMVSFTKPLTDEELISFVVHACQVAGEMDTPTSNDTEGNPSGSCSALRLAGMDFGITWSTDDFENPENIQVTSEGDEGSSDLAEAVFQNRIKNDDEPMHWNTASVEQNSGRRRLLEFDDDEDAYELEDYEYTGDERFDDGDYEHEDYMEDDDDHYVSPPPRKHRKNKGGYEPEGKHKELVESIRSAIFSKSRLSFLSRAEEINSKVSDILDAPDNNDDGEDDESEAGEATTEGAVDPAALNMVRSTLKGRQERISRGFLFGASATVLMQALRRTSPNSEQFRIEAEAMALGVIYHGKLSSQHLWQITQAVIPKFSTKLESAAEEHSCASPWANSCPPASITRGEGTIPPPIVLSAGESFCNDQVDEALQGLCASDSSDTIPVNIPEGFYGYHSTVPRGSDDPLDKMFNDMGSNSSNDEQMSSIRSLEDTRNDLEKQSGDLKKEMKRILKDIGGKKEDRTRKFGPGGELYALKDECHSVTAGKYVYEVCVFGDARQKDRDSPHSSGTSLGRWEGMAHDDKGRVLKWTNGQSCWNGPNRSATVHVTCGAENKVLSADEPDTCRYVLEMESPIACDDDYKQKHGL